MSTRNRQLWSHDPWGQLGRGLTMLLALALPFIGRLDAVPLAGGRVLPVASLLTLLIPVTAVASSATGGAHALRGRWVLPVLLLVGLLAGLGASGYGSDPVLAVAALWEPMLLVAGIAMLFSGHGLERLGLLTALVLSSLFATLLGFAELMGLPGFPALLRLFHEAPETWQLIQRLTGPLSNADALAWLAAVILPLLTAAAIGLDGRLKELLFLLIGLLWVATLLTLSYAGPIAALAGMLVVMTFKANWRPSLTGLSIPLLLGLAVALLYPGFRARWGPYDQPVGFVVRALTSMEGGPTADSLSVTLVNPGPTAWPEGYETGYHVLYPESENRLGREMPRLLRGGWVSAPIDRRVEPGGQVSVTLPFRSRLDSGFLVWDLQGPGGKITQYRGSPYLLLYQSDIPGAENRLGRLIHVRSIDYVQAANEALQRGRQRRAPPIHEVWTDVYGLFSARPWTGLGPGASHAMLGYNARNVFLEATVTGGWTGLALTVLLILGLNAGLLMRATLEAYALSGALFAAVLHGLSAFSLDDPSVRMAAMLLLGVAWAAAFERREPDGTDGTPLKRTD